MDVSIFSSPLAIFSARLNRHTTAACMQLPESTCFQGSRKEEVSVIRERTRDLFQHATWAWVEHVFIFTVRYEGLGTRHPAVSLWAPKLLHPAPIKEHKELFDSLYKPNMTNNCIVYCLIPLGCHDSVQHTAAVSLTALCYVCSEKVMICIDHC